MRGFIPKDSINGVSKQHIAVVYVPKRSRNRFAANCVQVCDNIEDAKKLAIDNGDKYYPAHVLGPSKSSEGQILYYLVDWL